MKINTINKAATLLLCGLIAAPLTGCSNEEPPPPPPPPPPPAPVAPPPPDRVNTEAKLQTLQSDARIEFPNAIAPYDESVANAIIAMAEALLAGDSDAFRAMIADDAKATLDRHLASGDWQKETDLIEGVRVVYTDQTPDVSTDAETARFVIAVQIPTEAYVIAWTGTDDNGRTWAGSPVTETTRPRASSWDGLQFDEYATATAGLGVSDLNQQEGPAAAMFFIIEVTRNISPNASIDVAYGIMERSTGSSRSELEQLYERGRELNEQGIRIPRDLLEDFLDQTGSAPDERFIAAVAQTYGMTIDEARAFIEGN